MLSARPLRAALTGTVCLLALTFTPATYAWDALEDSLDRLLINIGLWASGLEEKSLELSPGCSISYYDNGKTEATDTLVLLHGFSANKNLWLRMAASLKQYRVLAPDLAGHGQSCYVEGQTHTIPYYAGVVHAWLQKLNAGPVHLAGNSMGGWVSAQYTLSYPEAVRTLALMDAAGVTSPVQSAFMQAQARGDNVFFFNDEAGYDRLSHMAMVSPPALPGLVKNAHLRAYLALQPRFRKLFADITDSQGFAGSQLLDAQLPAIKAPTLILWGKQDQVVDVAMADVFRRGIAGSELVVLDGVGHVPMVEAAERTAAIYADFIGKHPAARHSIAKHPAAKHP